MRFPGQYQDKETGRAQNNFRDYDANIGRYDQSDLIGLSGGLNTYGYVSSKPLKATDEFGLLSGGHHYRVTFDAFSNAGYSMATADMVAVNAVLADWRPTFPQSQSAENANAHGMGTPKEKDPAVAFAAVESYIDAQIRMCNLRNFANALHAAQDTAAGGHNYGSYSGRVGSIHIFRDFFPMASELARARTRTQEILEKYERICGCLPGKRVGDNALPPIRPPMYYLP